MVRAIENRSELQELGNRLRAQLPPSERDFAVYEEVVVRCHSTRMVAGVYEISQTRVCQIVERVWQWQVKVLPRIDGDAAPEVLLKASKYLAVDRLNELYIETMQSFAASKGEQVKRRRDSLGHEITTTTRSHGEIRYLTAAMRIAGAQSQCGLPRGLMPASLALAHDECEAILPQAIAAVEAQRRSCRRPALVPRAKPPRLGTVQKNANVPRATRRLRLARRAHLRRRNRLPSD